MQIQSFGSELPECVDNIVAALEHPDRVLRIKLGNVTKFGDGKVLCGNAGAIPGADTSRYVVER
jgi:hypothetical protein